MKTIRSEELTPLTMPGSETEKDFIYNALDCMITMEVFEAIEPQLDNTTRATYEFSKSLQGPVLEMNMHGVLIDQEERDKVIRQYETERVSIDANLLRIVEEGVGFAPFNYRSNPQLQKLFYEVLKCPVITKKGRPTLERDALERLEVYFYAEPIIKHILALRDIDKKVSTLKTEIDSDGRLRTSYNICGTTTGRFSSSFSDFGSGGNLQNVEERLRRIVIADPGMKFAYIDLEQAESRAVGAIIYNLFNDPQYLDLCERGDLHSGICRMTYPNEFPWTGDAKQDRALAEGKIFYREKNYRDAHKVLGHGTVYYGKPPTMSKHTHIPAKTIAAFQEKFFTSLPGIPRWHERVIDTIKSDGVMTTIMGRRRRFMGRRDDASTHREAIAFEPQSMVADILNRGMLQVWRTHICELMMQIHDAILVQYPEKDEDTIVPQVLELIKVPVELNNGRTLLIPSDVKTGWNWSNWSPTNPDGLKKFKGHDDRARLRLPDTSILGRRVY